MSETCQLCELRIEDGDGTDWELVPYPNSLGVSGNKYHGYCVVLALDFGRIAVQHLKSSESVDWLKRLREGDPPKPWEREQ